MAAAWASLHETLRHDAAPAFGDPQRASRTLCYYARMCICSDGDLAFRTFIRSLVAAIKRVCVKGAPLNPLYDRNRLVLHIKAVDGGRDEAFVNLSFVNLVTWHGQFFELERCLNPRRGGADWRGNVQGWPQFLLRPIIGRDHGRGTMRQRLHRLNVNRRFALTFLQLSRRLEAPIGFVPAHVIDLPIAPEYSDISFWEGWPPPNQKMRIEQRCPSALALCWARRRRHRPLGLRAPLRPELLLRALGLLLSWPCR